MPSFNWIHISDLHYGLTDQGPLWPNVRQVFLDDLAGLHEKTGPWDAVIFTGDLTQQGSEEQFEMLDSEVLAPLWQTMEQLGSSNVRLIAVPGNHDVLRPDLKRQSAALRQLLRPSSFHEIEDEFWSDPQSEYRQVINTAFANYFNWHRGSNFCRHSEIHAGILPGDFSVSFAAGTDRAPLRIGIAGLNTSFLQLSGSDYKGRLVWDLKQIHSACQSDLPKWVGEHNACILLTHHGPDWLDARSRDVVYPEINPAGRFAVHLFGHMHEGIQRAVAQGGGPLLRQWQAASLFGMEKFGEPPTLERKHGYSVGRIESNDTATTIRYWPRVAIKDANGWRFERDLKSSILDEHDGGTVPENLSRTHETRFAKRKTVGTPSQRRVTDGAQGRSLSSSRWTWPHDEPQLRAYCEAVSKAHSHIRFVEIPYLKDLSDIELDSLYVEPRLSSHEIHPDTPLSQWPRSFQPIETLRQHPRVVLLAWIIHEISSQERKDALKG